LFGVGVGKACLLLDRLYLVVEYYDYFQRDF
jgi:hypothetical protein